MQGQFQREREDLLEDYRTLTQQIKLKNLVIACFIPPEYQDRIMQHCHWQDYDQTWSIQYLQYAGEPATPPALPAGSCGAGLRSQLAP